MAIMAIALCSLGGLIIVLNYGVALRYLLRRQEGSLLPILGGLLACAGMLLYPSGMLRPWAWIPLILDIGCLPMVFAALWAVIRGR